MSWSIAICAAFSTTSATISITAESIATNGPFASRFHTLQNEAQSLCFNLKCYFEF